MIENQMITFFQNRIYLLKGQTEFLFVNRSCLHAHVIFKISERLIAKTEESKCLAYTGLRG
jgi:hypothetical protein